MIQDGQINPANYGLRKPAHMVKAARRLHNSPWKTTIIHVKDGCNSYFNFKINLTTKRIYDLFVNGEV